MTLDPDDILNLLVGVRDEGEARPDEASQFVGSEARIAAYALDQTRNAMTRGDSLGGLQSLRLISETGIRLRWLVGDGEDQFGPDGRLLVDPGAARSRYRSMRKRDLLQLAAAYRSISEVNPSEERRRLEAQLGALAASIGEDSAPWDVGRMALSATARRIYAAHRMCSALIHPGAALGRRDRELIPRGRLQEMTGEAAYVAWAVGDGILRSLA
jgi:hypothetical protein